MWNKRKEEDYAPRPTATPAPAPAAPEAATRREPMNAAAPVAPAPAPRPAPEAEGSRGAAMVGKSVVLKGQIVSREDLYIDGEVEGTVELPEHRLTIGPHGRVQAGVKARELVVLGTVTGNVEATDKVDIRKEARLVGDLRTSRISIEDGAFFKGSVDIIRAGEAPRKPAATTSAPAPASAPSTVAAAEPMAASTLEQPKR